jgi:hypothetical protein
MNLWLMIYSNIKNEYVLFTKSIKYTSPVNNKFVDHFVLIFRSYNDDFWNTLTAFI